MIQAYCLYKTEALEDAQKLDDGETEALMQIKAQALYRQGAFTEAVVAFKAVKDVMDEDEDTSELLSNMMAAYTFSGDSESSLKEEFEAMGEQIIEEGSAFEMMFNVAASQIERNRYELAEASLLATKKACEESLEEDGFDEEEIANELAPILTQLGFVLQRLQQPEDAMDKYQSVLKGKPADVQVAAVAMNNVVSLKGDKDLFDSFKKTKSAQTESTEAKLTMKQKKAIAFNRALLLLHMNKPDQCTEYLKVLESAYPGEAVIGLLRASILAKQSPAKAEAALESAIADSEGGEHNTVMRLSLAQLQINAGATKKAIATLNEIEALEHRPALLGILTTLYEQAGDNASAIAVVESAIAYWNSIQTEKDVKETVLREGAKYLLKQQQYPQSAAAFEALLKIKRQDPEAVAGLVQACGNFDPERAEKYAESIPALEGADEIDAEALEEETVEAANKGARPRGGADMQGDDDAAAMAAVEAAAAEALALKRRALRQEKRKNSLEKRLPKDLVGTDPTTWRPLDAERWLPKRDRSYYKPRRGQKKNVGKYGGAQGAAMSEAHTKKYDFSDDVQKKEEGPASPEPQQQQGKKKKGRGKR